ncbi:DNA topoisomerase III [Peribacillus simplex]|uniref:type IA DNA topoisomerase n=1 Tax=Peribacillus TaxID=2675229 RepID=UPI000D0051C4|nr:MULTISPECIES: type IA DNA topoisomerase [Peribacillus]MCF7625454.1 DNA topoisomerase III [Peribacillus frigoritolerans]PRA78501.1 DNA topoisomerase III [Peribacillus simplex]
MSRPTILAEKPSQAKAYAEAFSVKKRDKTSIELNPCSTFPSGAIITWGIGHLVELKEPKEYKPEWGSWNLSSLPILPSNYEFKVAYGKNEQFNAVKKLFRDADFLVNGCDVDREGSNIFYSIYHMTGVKNKTIKRLWINSLEVDEVRKGFANLKDNQKDLLLYNEAKTRQIADWLIGMNGSRLYTLLLQQKGWKDSSTSNNSSISIGRVQSPVVFLIYKRQLEIENFVAKPFYEIEADFTVANGKYKGKAKIKSEKKEEVLNILKHHRITGKDNGVVKSVTKKAMRTKSPKLHALSTLQTAANKKWKYSPKQVLDTVQKLYDKKILSYPRTDTQFITENEFAYLSQNLESYQDIIKNTFQVDSREPKKRYVYGSKVQEHYAIIPTKTIPTSATLQGFSTEEQNIYFEVLNTTLAMFHTDYVYEETKVITDVNGLDFETTGKTEISKGWKELFKDTDKKDSLDKNKAVASLPIIEKDEKVLSVVKQKEGFTTPPKPYTEGDLILMMKTAGKSVEDKEDVEILKEIEGLGTEATRSGIIETIKKHGYIKVNKNVVSVTDKGKVLCQSIQGTLLSSPAMTAKWESYLKTIGEGQGSSKAFLSNIEKFINKLINEVPGQLKSEAIVKSIENIQNADQICLCPTCKKGSISLKKSFYGCSEYTNGCKQSFPLKILGKKITEKHVKDLSTKGKTSVMKGLQPKAKEKKPFDASLVLKDGSISFEFPSKVKK